MYTKQLLNKTGITKDTLRYYNEVKLLTPTVNPDNNYKIYSDEDVEKIELTKALQSIGFTIKEIIEIQNKLEDTRCKHKKTLPFLKEQQSKIQEKIAELKKLDCRVTKIIEDFEDRNCEVEKSEFVI